MIRFLVLFIQETYLMLIIHKTKPTNQIEKNPRVLIIASLIL